VVDVYSVPMPNIWTNCGGVVPLDYRLVVSALLCMEAYPCVAVDISLLTEELGHRVNGSKVGYIMGELCRVGFMRRERVGAQYRYKPDAWMLRHRAEWMKEASQ
jgi:hypothetical protein